MHEHSLWHFMGVRWGSGRGHALLILSVNPRKRRRSPYPRPRGPLAGLQLCPRVRACVERGVWEGCCHRVAAAAFEGLQWTGQGAGRPCAPAMGPRAWKGQRECPILGERGGSREGASVWGSSELCSVPCYSAPVCPCAREILGEFENFLNAHLTLPSSQLLPLPFFSGAQTQSAQMSGPAPGLSSPLVEAVHCPWSRRSMGQESHPVRGAACGVLWCSGLMWTDPL